MLVVNFTLQMDSHKNILTNTKTRWNIKWGRGNHRLSANRIKSDQRKSHPIKPKIVYFSPFEFRATETCSISIIRISFSANGFFWICVFVVVRAQGNMHNSERCVVLYCIFLHEKGEYFYFFRTFFNLDTFHMLLHFVEHKLCDIKCIYAHCIN